MGNIQVTERCKVSFSVEKYNDEVYFDVVVMDACHLLLADLDSLTRMLTILDGRIYTNWRQME